jgi:hypothetical protein
MAYTALTPLTALRTGITVADAAMTAAVAGGHSFVNDGDTILLMLNTNAATRTVTIQTSQTIDGLAVADQVIVLAIGSVTATRVMTSRFPRSIYNQTDGTVLIDYSAITNVSVAAIKIPKELIQ